MGELHVNMNITLDGVIQANGGTTEQDAGYEYGGWEIFAGYWPGQPNAIGLAFDRVPKYVASRGTPPRPSRPARCSCATGVSTARRDRHPAAQPVTSPPT